MKSKTDILSIVGSWQEVVDDCRSSVNKPPLGKEPSKEFKLGLLIAEHTPIRLIRIRWRWTNLPSWVATHWVRNTFYKVVSTQRSDRTGVPRNKLPQDVPVTYTGAANPQHLIDTARKRLCFQASPETRRQAEDLKATLKPLQPEISFVMVPNCIYRCGCPEIDGGCGWYQKTMERYQNLEIDSTDIQKRYYTYNELFYATRNGELNDNTIH